MLRSLRLRFPREVSEEIQAMIAPVYIAGKRLGTLFLARRTRCYGIEDIILTEYSTTVVGLEMMRAVSEEDDFASRKKQEIESILHILSPLEKSAVKQVIQRIEQGEGTIVTSRLAKEVGITRTVIVNALKKVESAGLIQTKSYGVKGTHIKVMNDKIYTDFVTQKMEMDF